MRIIAAVFCEEVIRNADNNSISLINVFEEFRGISYPISIPKLTFVIRAQKEGDDGAEVKGKVCIYNNDERLSEFSLVYRFHEKERCRIIGRADGFMITEVGKLEMRLYKENEGNAFYKMSIPCILNEG